MTSLFILPIPMPLFGAKLEESITAAGWSNTTFAAKLPGVVSQPIVGRYVRGEVLPKGDTLIAICKLFPENANALARCWVRDHFSGSLDLADGILKPSDDTEASGFPSDLPENFKTALNKLATLGAQHEEIRDALVSLAAVFALKS